MANESTFPALYADIPTQNLLTAFIGGPQRLKDSLRGLTEEDLLAHPRAGKWSIQQIACHLADAEVMGALRFRMVFADDGSRLPVYDQEEWERRFGYQELSAKQRDALLALFASARDTTARFLDPASDEDWQRSGYHPEWGPLSLRQLLELYSDHSERHIEQILNLRSLLGKPLELPLLLKKRLY